MSEDSPSLLAVAIDGLAGAGKSSVARTVAARLDYLYVDTGAMYRAVALAAVEQCVNMEDHAAMGAVARECDLRFDESGEKIYLHGKDVSADIRTPELTRKIKFAASSPQVRSELVRQQQEIARRRPVVMEGRDITTVVLPDARWKFYLDASVECRARRRLEDIRVGGREVALAELMRDIEERDQSDFNRAVGPLKQTEEQIYLDTSEMNQDEVVDWITARVNQDEH